MPGVCMHHTMTDHLGILHGEIVSLEKASQ